MKSSSRWTDLPALLLLHRPTRCRNCGRRVFIPRFTRRPLWANRLWTHYLAASLLLVAGCASLNNVDVASALRPLAPHRAAPATPPIQHEVSKISE